MIFYSNNNMENPKESAGSKKINMYLIPPIFKKLVAQVLQSGANKYGPWNWRKDDPIKVSTYISAMQRHLDAFQDGETLDPESGITHLAHVAAGVAILLDAEKAGNLNDDRNIIASNDRNIINNLIIKRISRDEQINNSFVECSKKHAQSFGKIKITK